MSIKVNQELLERYHSGLCTTSEADAVEDWLDSSEPKEDLLVPDIDLEALEEKNWEEMVSKMESISNRQRTKLRQLQLAKIAACTLLFIGVSLFVYKRMEPKPNTDAISYHTVTAKRGQKAFFKLPDGTSVALNSQSSLRYPSKFTAISRLVEFEGEGFFIVAKDANRPFSVKTKATTTTVLGTRFNVSAYQEDNNTSVVVEEGCVKFTSNKSGEQVLLTANEVGICNNATLVEHQIAIGHLLSWRKNQLSFNNERMAAIVPRLERWYNVHVVLKRKALDGERFTGKFDNPDIREVLNSLSFALKFNYTIINNNIIIY